MNDWKAVWRHIEARRIELGWRKWELYRTTGLSESSFLKMKNHNEGVADQARLVRVCRELDWTPDSIDRILAGGEPQLQADPGATVALPAFMLALPDDVAQLRSRVDALEERLSALESPPPPIQLHPDPVEDVPLRRAAKTDPKRKGRSGNPSGPRGVPAEDGEHVEE